MLKRRRKGKPVSRGVTRNPISGGCKYGNLALQVDGVSNLRR
jgi:hypothetical protein